MNNVGNLDPGFAFHNRAMLAVDTGLRNYDTAKAATFFKDLLREVRSLPGVKSATTARSVPLGFNSFGYNVYVEGEGEGQTKEERSRPILSDIVETDYFATLGFRLLDGRLFEESDNPDSRQVAVVNTQMSETLWPNQSPLGKRFSLDKPGGPYVEVVGIVNTAFYSFPGEPVQPFFYLPLRSAASPGSIPFRTCGGRSREHLACVATSDCQSGSEYADLRRPQPAHPCPRRQGQAFCFGCPLF